MQMLQAAVITQSYAFARLLTGLRWVTNIRDCCLEDCDGVAMVTDIRS